MGVLLYSMVPFSWTYYESLGLSLEGRSKFSVISACSKRRSQFFMGKSRFVEKSPVMKWSLNVLIVRSDTLRQCIPRDDSWKSMFLALSSLWKSVEASFSSIIYSGLVPLVGRGSWRSLRTRMNSLSDLSFMGSINILFLSYSYINR